MRYHNRIAKLNDDRLPRIIYTHELNTGKKGWVREVLIISCVLHLPPPSLDRLYDLSVVEAVILKKSLDEWWQATVGKSKLHTYIQFKNTEKPTTLVKSNLKRHTRSFLAKLVSGIMPLEIETGRYTGTKEKLQLCKVCNLNAVENETHFLFSCISYQLERSSSYLRCVPEIGDFMLKSDVEKIAWLMSPDNIKNFSDYVETIYRTRREILYKVN